MPTWDEISPYTDRAVRAHRLTATNVLIALNILGFALSGILPGVFGRSLAAFTFEAHQAIGRGWLWQFATFSFLHSIDIWYMFWFIFFAYLLYQYGNELENELGMPRFLTIYFSCAVYGALAQAIYQYVSGSTLPTQGFFAPVFGVMTAYAIRYPSRPVLFFFVIPMRLITSIILCGAIAFVFCLSYAKAGVAPVSIFVAPFIAWGLHKAEPRLDRWLDSRQVRQERSQFIEEVEVRREVDALLDKISREGMGALTPHEKKILKRASDVLSRKQGFPE